MVEKVKCPICGSTLKLEAHPSKINRQVAYCSCRGSKVSVVEATKSPTTRDSILKKESE